MFDEKEFRDWLNQYTKEQLIDLYIQKTFDVYMTTKYGEGGCEFDDKCENGQFATSGYLEELNPDGTRKYPIPQGETTTYTYCGGCEEKDKIIADLENKIDKMQNLIEEVVENVVDLGEDCRRVIEEE